MLTWLQQTVWVSSSEKASIWGDSHAHQFNVECGVWSEHQQADPSLFNLCSNADSTPTPIFRRKHLDVMLSTWAQILWTTHPRPVLSGPRSFKTLDDLSHCAQFQGIGNLLVALAIFMQCNNTSFKILREFFVMWCYVGTFSDQYERVWELHYKFEHTCSLCTHRPSNTNESYDILEGKWLAVLNSDI